MHGPPFGELRAHSSGGRRQRGRSLAPGGVTFALAVFVTHYATRGFCGANFRQEVISILRVDGDFERQ